MIFPAWGVVILTALWAFTYGVDVYSSAKYRRWEREQALKYLRHYPPKRYER